MNLTSPVNDISPEPYLNATDAAKHLSISAKKLLSLARSGDVPAHGIGTRQRKMWRFRLSELDLWMQTEVSRSRQDQTKSFASIHQRPAHSRRYSRE